MNAEKLAEVIKAQEAKQPLPCTRCNGAKISISLAFEFEGRQYPERRRPCGPCKGTGEFPPVDVHATILATKGRKGLRSQRPKETRAYYVWRWARFHGGVDVTMPVMASMEISGDPFFPVLDKCAEELAKVVFGSDMRGAMRWGQAFGII